MTPSIVNDYEITQDTIALLPAHHIECDTIVWERNDILHVKQSMLSLIKEACLEGGADYEGRRAAVIHKTGIQHKIPIPIHPLDHIYAFPTHSPKLYECAWIFYYHIKSIHRHPNKVNESMVTFHNYKELTLPISYATLEKQMQRTSYCIVRFSDRLIERTFR
ncbi:competence protein ComK [Halalkalibacter sp. APA_J-10(15)]|uniref:competence protein ComK n=1 Tax=Halalkalibacter sp. APA_J-10(15) TaxID=2933805 RepID=UPI001FF25960|nr:competence protein ComK [Halalkalibacter sp. APA_J-10(15)]MCK0470097.1 competence protein ComK [Halalkalibacter sp. APA_J-10(15)]